MTEPPSAAKTIRDAKKLIAWVNASPIDASIRESGEQVNKASATPRVSSAFDTWGVLFGKLK